MKVYQGTFYKARYLTGGEIGERCETLEKMRDAIVRDNEHNKVYGYEQHQFFITLVQWVKVFDDDDLFVSESETEARVEMFPETIPLSFPKTEE